VIDTYDIMDMHIDSITISSIYIQDTYCHILLLEATCPLTKIMCRQWKQIRGVVSHYGLDIYIKKDLKAKEEL
jgi:hypothetical protein